MKRNRPVPMLGAALWTTLILAIVALLPATASAGEEVTIDGVVHVKNGAEPSQGVETLKLEEIWRAGGEDDQDVLFGLVIRAKSDAEGNLYLVDTQLSQVHVFSPDGEFLNTLSREGEGPGEVRRPRDMIFMPDGTLGLVQIFPGKIIKIGKDGVPAGEVMIGGTDPGEVGQIALLDGLARGDNLVLGGASIAQIEGGQNRTVFLASYSATGEETVRYAEREVILNFANFDFHEKDQYFMAPDRWTLGPEGYVYAAPERDAYVINIYSPDGTLQRVIEREFTCPNRPPDRMALFESARDAQLAQLPPGSKIGLSPNEPAITSLRVTDDGTMWVLHAGSVIDQPEGVMQTYDVFDAKGHFIKQVAAGCQGDGLNDGLFFVGTDRLVKVTGIIDAAVAMQGGLGAASDEEAAPMEVICYRILS